MPSLPAAQTANAQFSPSYIPVAVFSGGTSGIGQAIAEKLAFYTSGNAHIFIIGRDRAAGEETIARFPKPSVPGVVHEFIPCDATLISNINAVTESILARFNKVNFLVMSAGGLPPTFTSNMTEEGLERSMVLLYYSKWKLVDNFIPALLRAQEDGEMTKVFSVLGSGRGKPIDLENLGVKKDFSFWKAVPQIVTYQDIMLEDFAARYPTLTMCHVTPGPVASNLYTRFFKAPDAGWGYLTLIVVMIRFILTYPFLVSASISGEYLLYGMLNSGPGVHRIGPTGEDIPELEGRVFGTEEEREKLREHTIREIDGVMS
ncbi:NAD-P-binding protein [Mycena floridula]|nr:NAD-P-binding protein [Mycena floridula]